MKKRCGTCIWWAGELALGPCVLPTGMHHGENRWNTQDACANHNDPRPIQEAERERQARIAALKH